MEYDISFIQSELGVTGLSSVVLLIYDVVISKIDFNEVFQAC